MTHPRTDANQGEIVDGLRKAGYWVFITSGVKCGYPDLTVIMPGAVALLEVKRKGEKLTPQEGDFHERAGAMYSPVFVVYSLEDALRRIGEVMRG